MAPDAQFQIDFLANIQKLLSDGEFVATYKYALLRALVDICVENSASEADQLVVSTDQIALKFIELYWSHATPYPGGNQVRALLHQNSNPQKPAKLITEILKVKTNLGSTIAQAKRHRGWNSFVSRVARTIEQQPLWRLQVVGPQKVFDFLYKNSSVGRSITLKPGIAYCFHKFHDLLQGIIHSAWAMQVRNYNQDLIGNDDLEEFLFGCKRRSLVSLIPILMDNQNGNCFYCQKVVKENSQVDHFIPWSKYKRDLGHNFVLSHQNCNGQKGNHIAAVQHLERWVARNSSGGVDFVRSIEEKNFVVDLIASNSITKWAYGMVENVGGWTWESPRRFVPLNPEWRVHLHF